MLIPAASATDLLLAIAAFVIVLFPAIIIHELGHFIAAKLVGINVLEFGLGFPPRLGPALPLARDGVHPQSLAHRRICSSFGART